MLHFVHRVFVRVCAVYELLQERLAGVVAQLKKPALRGLIAAHLTAALAVWRYCDQSARIVFGSLAGNPIADNILGMLRTATDGMRRTDISNAFDRHQSARAITTALTELNGAGLARSETRQTKGRPEERWFAI